MSVYRIVSDIFSVKNGVTLKPVVDVVQGHWKWRRSIDHIYDFLLVRHCKHSPTLYHFWVIWRWIILWPWNLDQRSFKLVPFERLSAVSYSPSIVTMAVSLTVC